MSTVDHNQASENQLPNVAKLKLADILRRYNMAPEVTQPGSSSSASKMVVGTTKLEMAVETKCGPIARLAEEMAANPPLLSGSDTWSPVPSGDVFEFHFLIRIAECSVQLHCEVTAETSSVAWNRVQQIPNLLFVRELSPHEVQCLATLS